MKHLAWIALAIVSLAAASVALSQTNSNDCSRLTSLKLPHVAITGAAMAQNSFCRVKGTASPTSDSAIGFEVWIPRNWNGRYLRRR